MLGELFSLNRGFDRRPTQQRFSSEGHIRVRGEVGHMVSLFWFSTQGDILAVLAFIVCARAKKTKPNIGVCLITARKQTVVLSIQKYTVTMAQAYFLQA